jgi:hypothetical protein
MIESCFGTGLIAEAARASSKFTLWEFWNEKNKAEGWVSEEEFNAVLSLYNPDGERSRILPPGGV